MLKKTNLIFGFTILFLFLAQTNIVSAEFVKFTDVPDAHKNARSINSLKEAGIVTGYGDNTFKPDNPVNRAEAVAIILKAAGITAAKSSLKLRFTDVSDAAWYFPMIQKGVSLGKLKGYEDRTFRPENPVTLPEALALALSFFQMDYKKTKVEEIIYDGLDPKAWYAKQAQFAKDKNIIEPDANGHIDPAKPLTRGELAEFIYRVRPVQRDGKPFDITEGWTRTEYLENFWSINHPADWEIFQGQTNSVIWKQTGPKVFFTRVWPTSCRISISVVNNAENQTAATYFANLKEAYSKDYAEFKPVFSELQLSGKNALKISVPKQRILDIAVYLPNKNFLVMYGECGRAPIAEFLKKQMELAMMSYQYVEKPPQPPKPVIPLETRMETLRENILIEDKWKETAPNFPDKKLIHTDAIGVGTGPVDYYYSAEANNTIKLERSTGTILNIREGETYAF